MLSRKQFLPLRLIVYIVVALFGAVIFLLARDSAWKGEPLLYHGVLLATVIFALVNGLLSLGRFYTQRSVTFLFIGAGFLAVALLDAYHGFTTSGFYRATVDTVVRDLSMWTLLFSRAVLDIAILVSVFFWFRQQRKKTLSSLADTLTYFAVVVLVLVCVTIYTYLPGIINDRMVNSFILLVAALHVIVIVAYFVKGNWREHNFDHWLIIALIVNLENHLFFVMQTRELFDGAFIYAGLFRLLSYAIVFVALLVSISAHFRRSETQQEEFISQNIDLRTARYELDYILTALEMREGDLEKNTAQLEKAKKTMVRLLHDLKEKRKANDEAKAKDAALLESIGDGVIATDERGFTIFINKAAEDILRWESHVMVGKSLPRISTLTDDQDKHVDYAKHPIHLAIIGRKKIAASDYAFKRSDGTSVPVHIIASPVIIDGEVVGAIEVFRDITKEKEVDRAKTEFVLLASHQLRTPLSAVNWYSEMLLAGIAGEMSSEQREYLREIYNGNQRMIDLVDALLNVSRIAMGTFVIEPEWVNVDNVVDNVLKELLLQIEEKKIVVEKEYGATEPMYIDKRLLHIVFQNLFSNAIKYTPPRGTLRIGIEKREKDFFVTVADNGYGIPEEQHNKIFTKLFRADNAREKVADGNGLGLYIVKAIVEQSGGKIWFTSAIDKGTTFFLAFPLHPKRRGVGARPPA